MAKNWKALFQEKFGGNTKLFTMVLCGILLFIIAMPTGKKEVEENTGMDGEQQARYMVNESATGSLQAIAYEDYINALEKRLTESLSKVAGVGAVQVMISLKSSEELVVEKEQWEEKNTTNESDGDGGKRIINESTTQENTIYVSNGTEKEPYVVKTMLPEIHGVLVVAKGAGTGNVNRTIVEIVQALFGLEAHKVKVVKME